MAGFDRGVRALVPGDDLTDAEKEFLSSELSNVFFAHGRDGEGSVNLSEFCSGFSLFGAGSKSDKLAHAFQLIDMEEGGSGALSRFGMQRYLQSFLSTLLALSRGAAGEGAAREGAAERGAARCSALIFDEVQGADAEAGGGVTFEAFASWYTNGGYDQAAWLELLDPKKWPSQ